MRVVSLDIVLEVVPLKIAIWKKLENISCIANLLRMIECYNLKRQD